MGYPCPKVPVQNPNETAQGDWRKGGYRDGYQAVPPAPRKPGPFAEVLIHSYQGGQRVQRTIGIVFLVVGVVIVLFIGRGTPTDIALGLWGKPYTAIVAKTERLDNVKVNRRHPTEITYRYEINGTKYEESSYTTDYSILPSMTRGAPVPIQLLTSAPSWSRIQGTTRSQMGLSALFYLLFPLAGAGMFSSAYSANRREIRAFRDGVPTKGRIIKRGWDKHSQTKGQHPFEIIWEFQIDGTTYQGKLSNAHADILNRAFPDEEVTVLYDRRDPKINTVWVEG